MPASYVDFEAEYGVQFMFVGKKTLDSDDVGLVKNRMGFYTTGQSAEMKNLLMLLDEVFKFRLSFSDDRFECLPSLPDIVVHTGGLVNLEISQTQDCTQCAFQVVTESLGDISVLDLPPPVFPPRHVVLKIEIVDALSVHLVLAGNTKPFQAGFVKNNIPLTSARRDGETYSEYYRVKKNVSLETPADAVACVRKLCGDECLHGAPLVVRCGAKVEPGTELSMFVDGLLRLPNVIYKDVLQ